MFIRNARGSVSKNEKTGRITHKTSARKSRVLGEEKAGLDTERLAWAGVRRRSPRKKKGHYKLHSDRYKGGGQGGASGAGLQRGIDRVIM